MRVPKAAPMRAVTAIASAPQNVIRLDAYHLARLGHQVDIRDARPLPGGMLHFGIPAYRLPRDDLAKEILRIEQMGVRIVINHKVENLLAQKEAGRFDAVLAASGLRLVA
jgi:NADPH-dependent glutamate synthase beta subunit-like oxidoreductase